ncbi:MAG: hypothetical protein ACOY93_04115 [Bacillota bacterium]
MRWAVIGALVLLLTATAGSNGRGSDRLPEPPGIGTDLRTLPPAPVDWGPESRYPGFKPFTEGQLAVLQNLSIDLEAVQGRRVPAQSRR